MEEDEEVDIVGGMDDFMSKNEREISNISSGQILSCEYTVHPLWLADNNDGTELWPENLPKQSSQDEMELVQDEVVIEEPAPIDFNWCEEQETEEVSICGDIILEQDIPASLEEEVVTNSSTEAEYEDNYDFCSLSPSINRDSLVNSTHVKNPNSTWSKNSRSLLKSTFVEPAQVAKRPVPKFKQTLFVNKNILKLNQYKFSTDQSAGTSLLKSKVHDKKVPEKKSSVPAIKFKQSVALLKSCIPTPQNDRLKNAFKRFKERPRRQAVIRKVNTGSVTTGKHTGGKRSFGKSISGKMFVDLHGENITINHDADSGPNFGELNLSIKVPVESEVVKVKNESDSDIEIDIESDAPLELNNTNLSDTDKPIKIIIEHFENFDHKTLPEPKIKMESISGNYESLSSISQQYSTTLSNDLKSMKTPIEELKVHSEIVSEMEKFFHAEFFEGRPTKTPERYLKIRDFILNTWRENQPTYVSKTTVRNGLKHCGDVNCISRIHCMLEQIGAINFGHGGDQFEYIRPLSKLKEHFIQSTKSKTSDQNASTSLVVGRRQRMKNLNGQLFGRDIDANYTVSHANGIPSVVFQAVPEREHYRREASSKPIKVEFELIECLRFTKDQIPPFKISITLSTLLCLHLHALSSKYEVMGFLGGYYSKSVGSIKLSLTRYKPCETASQTGTTCEMCPVSQVEQASSLTSEGYDLLGWFHSHPTFEPNPSRTDVATQADMQHQFSMESDRPFIGFILGCIDMRYKCMYILPNDLQKEANAVDVIPYVLDVDVIKDCSSLRNEIADVFSVISRDNGTYFTSIEKFTRTANNLLKQHGYESNILEYIQNYL